MTIEVVSTEVKFLRSFDSGMGGFGNMANIAEFHGSSIA